MLKTIAICVAVWIAKQHYGFLAVIIKKISGIEAYPSKLITTFFFHLLFLGFGGYILNLNNTCLNRDSLTQQSISKRINVIIQGVGLILLSTLTYGLFLPKDSIKPTISNNYSSNYQLLTFVFVCISGPLLEEYFFRKNLQNALKSMLGGLASVCLTAFIFAAMHGLSNHLPIIFFSGLIYGFSYQSNPTLIIPFTQHAIVNCIAFLIGITNSSSVQQAGHSSTSIWIQAIFFCITAAWFTRFIALTTPPIGIATRK